MDYRVFWTTRTFRLSPFGLLGINSFYKYHSAKAKNNRIRRVIINNSFDFIESDPGNIYKYMK